MLNEIKAWILEYSAIVSILGAIFSAVFTVCNKYIEARFQRKAHEEAEKISLKIKQEYMLTEIKVRNVHEIYPKLYKLMRLSGALVVYFDTIIQKIKEEGVKKDEKTTGHIKLWLKEYFFAIIHEDPSYSFNKILTFADYYETSALYISEIIDEMIKEQKDLLMELYQLVKNEIANDKYKSQTDEHCVEIVNRAQLIIQQLQDNKSRISRQMNQELNPA